MTSPSELGFILTTPCDSFQLKHLESVQHAHHRRSYHTLSTRRVPILSFTWSTSLPLCEGNTHSSRFRNEITVMRKCFLTWKVTWLVNGGAGIQTQVLRSLKDESPLQFSYPQNWSYPQVETPLVALCMIIKYEYITETEEGRRERDSASLPMNFQSELGPDLNRWGGAEKSMHSKNRKSFFTDCSNIERFHVPWNFFYWRGKQN